MKSSKNSAELLRKEVFVVVDPGTATGVLLVDIRDLFGDTEVERLREGLEDGSVQALEVDTRRWWEPDLAETLEGWMRSALGSGWVHCTLVVEDFILRTADKRRTTLDPIRVTSCLVGRLQERGWKGKLVLQQPSQMTVANDKRLREWKLWIKGSAHKRDTVRHAIVWMRTR